MAELGYRVTPLGVAFHRGLTNLRLAVPGERQCILAKQIGSDSCRHRRQTQCGTSCLRRVADSFAQNMILARKSPVTTATAVATMPGIMNEWLSTYLPIFVVPDRSKLIAAISEPYVGMKK